MLMPSKFLPDILRGVFRDMKDNPEDDVQC